MTHSGVLPTKWTDISQVTTLNGPGSDGAVHPSLKGQGRFPSRRRGHPS